MTEAGKATGGDTIILGGPPIEVAKAFHELVEALEDLMRIARGSWNALRRTKAGRAADNLYDLSCQARGGFIGPLTRIADGKGTRDDAEKLRRLISAAP